MREFIKAILKYPVMLLNKVFLYFYYEFSEKRFYYRDRQFEGKKKKVLVFAPHVDDETIGLGASLIKHRDRGDRVSLVYMTDGAGATSDLSKEELANIRKEEARKLGEILKLENLIFLDMEDSKVESDIESIERVSEIIREENPDIIYTPFIIDGHRDHVNTSRIVLYSAMGWRESFEDVYMYEVNTRLRADIINAVTMMDKEDFKRKDDLYRVFESQYVMGFDAFSMVDRAKRFLASPSYALESFVRMDLKQIKALDDYLKKENFQPEDFRQLSSRYNLLTSYFKNRKLKDRYMEKVKSINKL